MNLEAFFTLHRDLPREGPGTPEDVAYACALAALAPDARILDAGCGPGADIAALRTHAPQGRLLAVDTHAPFVEAARALHAGDPGVRLASMDMTAAEGPFDFIWSAGALYFLGIESGLHTMAAKLAPGGSMAFSHLVYTTDTPDPALRAVLDAEPGVMTEPELAGTIRASGFDLLGQRLLPEASWAAYYTPMQARIDALRPGATGALVAVLDEGQAEIDLRARFADQWGYALSVVRPA